MATFEELMEKFRNPGETGIPENFADELTAAYQNDLSVRDAAVKEREAKLAEFDKEREAHADEVRKLKATNYDLMVSAPKPGDKSSGNENENPDDTEPRGIDSLFEKETR